MNTTQTIHYAQTKTSRYNLINSVIGWGETVRSFTYDRGHPNGPEIHTVTSTGIIIVRNQRTNKLITLLIARPHQITRLYNLSGESAPATLLNIAYQHWLAGYNEK